MPPFPLPELLRPQAMGTVAHEGNASAQNIAAEYSAGVRSLAEL